MVSLRRQTAESSELSHLLCVPLGLTEVLQEVFRLAALDSVSDRSRSSEGDAKTGSVVVICGTGYIMPDAREFLGIVEPRYSAS